MPGPDFLPTKRSATAPARRLPLLAAGAALAAAFACGGGDRGGDRAAAAGAAAAATDAAGAQGSVGALGAEGAVDTAELGRRLAGAAAATTLSEADRRSLELAMERLLEPAASACEGCRATVTYVDEPAGGDYFRCEVRSASGDSIADLHLFHRPALAAEAAEGWGRRRLGGHPASGFDGDHLFVWPGRFEVRAFARDSSLRGEGRLAAWLEELPLDVLARL